MYIDEETRKIRQAAVARCRAFPLDQLAADLPMTKASDRAYSLLSELADELAQIPDADAVVNL